jgi:hypothetical protein
LEKRNGGGGLSKNKWGLTKTEVQNWEKVPHRYKKPGTPYRVCCTVCKGITSPYLVFGVGGVNPMPPLTFVMPCPYF